MDNELNRTQSTIPTSNPQGATSTEGASNAADFQSTAPSEALNEQTESLSVQETGQPAEGVATVAADGLSTLWIGIIVVVIAIGGWLLFKLLKETVEEESRPAPKPAAKTATTAKKAKTTSKSSARKTTKKKSAPNQRRKKTTKKKR